MRLPSGLVLRTHRHLKWRALDIFEAVAMIVCGIALAGFTLSVFCDVMTRTIGHPWLWLQEVTSTFFVYGIFVGTAAATRRSDHLYLSAVTEKLRGKWRLAIEVFNRLIVLAVALCMTWFGYINFLQGFGNYRMPSMTPLSSYYAAIPLAGILIALFTIEQIVNGWRNGFEDTEPEDHVATFE